MPTGLFRFFLVVLAGLSLGTGALFATMPSCTRQLTVDEADSALSASCVVLAQVMAAEHPELLERAAAQACQPGKTRQSLARILAQLSTQSSSYTEHLELKGDPYTERTTPASLSDAGGVP